MVEYDTHDWRSHLLDIRGSMVREIVYRVLSVTIFTIAVVTIDQFFDFNLGVEIYGHTFIGTALGLLLVFRTNAAYDRFWEGRKLWGSIINESRNLARVVSIHLKQDRQLAEETIRWGIAFAWSTMHQLRKERGLGEVANELPAEEVRTVHGADHPPLAVSRAISERLLEARNKGLITEYVMVSMDQNVQLMIDYMGACERIRNTQLPFAYMVHLRRALIAYCFTLPFALVNHFGWLTIAVVILISYTMFGIEEIGVEIEGPFGDDENDLPLESFCQTIERNMRGVLMTLDSPADATTTPAPTILPTGVSLSSPSAVPKP